MAACALATTPGGAARFGPPRAVDLRGLRLLRELGGRAPRDDDDGDGGVAGDLWAAGAGGNARGRADRARAGDGHVAVLPLDVVERLVPVLALPDGDLELPRDGRQVLDLGERRVA